VEPTLKTTVPCQHLNPGNTHVELINQIGHVKSLLNNLTQKTRELKARLNELAERKNGAGKSPRKIQAPSNRFDTPIPKIQGRRLIDTTSDESSSGMTIPAAASDSMFSSSVTLVEEIAKVRLEDQAFEHDTQMNDHTPDPVPQVFQPQAADPHLDLVAL